MATQNVTLSQQSVALSAMNDTLYALMARVGSLEALTTQQDSLAASSSALISQLTSQVSNLTDQLALMSPPPCSAPGGDRLQYVPHAWVCVCTAGWTGADCSTPPSSPSPPMPPSPRPPSPPPLPPGVVKHSPSISSHLGAHTCALLSSGGVQCWGVNTDGQLGHGGTTNSPTPVAVTGLTSGVVAVSTGGGHTCGLLSTGKVQCWGTNYDGQLGIGTFGDDRNRHVPVAVTGLTTAVAALALGNRHSCALLSSGGVVCWGYNGWGQLGNLFAYDPGSRNNNQATPVPVNGLSSGVIAIAAGTNYNCAVLATGNVKCWGSNWCGQLGNGGIIQRGQPSYYDLSTSPVSVIGLSSGAVAVAAGDCHTCALLSSGGVQCWGDNSDGQLGDGGISLYSYIPVTVIGLTSGVATLTTGGRYTCALLVTGAVQCWGYNAWGEVGNGGTENTLTAVSITALSSAVVDLAAGGHHNCALFPDGSVQCWGQNLLGQLGNGTTLDSLTPVLVSGLVVL